MFFDLNFKDGEMWMFTDDLALGPFCKEKRRKRRNLHETIAAAAPAVETEAPAAAPAASNSYR